MTRSRRLILGSTLVGGVALATSAAFLMPRAPALSSPVRGAEPASSGESRIEVYRYKRGQEPPLPPPGPIDPATDGGASVWLVRPPGQERTAVVDLPRLPDGRLDIEARPEIRVPGRAILPGYFRFVVEFIRVENCCGEGEQEETRLARYEFDPIQVNQGQAYTEPVSLPVPHPGPACNINVQVEQGCYETDADLGGIPTHWERVANQQVTIRADG